MWRLRGRTATETAPVLLSPDEQHDVAAPHAAAWAAERRLLQASAEAFGRQRWLKAAQQFPLSASWLSNERRQRQKSALRRGAKFWPPSATRPQSGQLSPAERPERQPSQRRRRWQQTSWRSEQQPRIPGQQMATVLRLPVDFWKDFTAAWKTY